MAQNGRATCACRLFRPYAPWSKCLLLAFAAMSCDKPRTSPFWRLAWRLWRRLHRCICIVVHEGRRAELEVGAAVLNSGAISVCRLRRATVLTGLRVSRLGNSSFVYASIWGTTLTCTCPTSHARYLLAARADQRCAASGLHRGAASAWLRVATPTAAA